MSDLSLKYIIVALLSVLLLHNVEVQAQDLSKQVLIRRTQYGVPHIKAENLRAGFFGLAYVQLQDYGKEVAIGLIEARGEIAIHKGREYLDDDFVQSRLYNRAVEMYSRLPKDVRAAYEGFAAGVNHYIRLHPEEFPEWMKPKITGYDVLASDIRGPSLWQVNDFIEGFEQTKGKSAMAATKTPWAIAAQGKEPPPDGYGSNAWALAPGRTESGNAILVRNPHLGWDAGYYEAQMTISGHFNFYGDFRVGGPFGTIGGFNEHVAWATTNNYASQYLYKVYALEVDPDQPGHYLFNGASLPIIRDQVTVAFKNGDGVGRETRVFLSTEIGPIIYRGGGKIYVYRQAGAGEYREGWQLLRMMQADNLNEWKTAMSMRADDDSNYTYADDSGNIFYLWNATIPKYVHQTASHNYSNDPIAIPAAGTSDIWTELVPFDALPQLKNPEGGYLLNSNDSFHYTNMNEIMEPEDFPPYFRQPEFDLRSQLSYQLIGGDEKLTLEEVIRLKNNERMLLADRVKEDLIAAVRASEPTSEVAKAIQLIADWKNTAEAESQGSALFAVWWSKYEDMVDSKSNLKSPFAKPWTVDAPTSTPVGLASSGLAAEAFAWAVGETKERWGDWDISWGSVHRARRGEVDVPIGGCSGSLGCFRVIWYDEAKDGKLVASGGDGWVLAVEMGATPRAYSILAYGQSDKPESPYYDAQLSLFANKKMKPVAFTEKQIQNQLIKKYHPGGELKEK